MSHLSIEMTLGKEKGHGSSIDEHGAEHVFQYARNTDGSYRGRFASIRSVGLSGTEITAPVQPDRAAMISWVFDQLTAVDDARMAASAAPEAVHGKTE